MDSKVEQAREWAESVGDIEGLHPEPRAAVEVILSLPDEWIDAEKLREVIQVWRGKASQAMHRVNLVCEVAVNELEALLTTSLPTLAELIDQGNDPQKYQWMQCTVEGRGDDTFVIASVRELVTKVLLPDGMHEVKGNSQVTPLPDLPKLEWPGSTPDDVAYATGGTLTTQDVVDECLAVRKERALPRSEDVPAGEPWIVQYEDKEWIGCRNDPGTRLPWLVIGRDYHEFDYCYDVDIALISRLVPERKENA